MTPDPAALPDFAVRYTTAWCSQDAASVAAFYSPEGSLAINGGAPAVGRKAITEVAQSFMTAFPDMRVILDEILAQECVAIYRWTLLGTNTGPGGTGRRVRLSGFEEWKIGEDGLISESKGHFDAKDYQRQLEGGLAAPKFLHEHEVRARLRMPELIDAMERALVEFSAGRIQQPVRTVFGFGTKRSLFGLMPSYVPSLSALGAKLVTVCPDNAAREFGTHQAVIVMLNPVTGVMEAVLDGRYITEVRTAAVSAVSARRLARRDAQVLAIVGSGVQAHSHLAALSLVHQFREVRVWSPNAERRRQFAAETGARAMDNAEAAVRGADIVVAATASPKPVIQNEWVADGAHVISVGACVPSERELDPELVARGRLVVDSREAALLESGDIAMGIAEGRWTAEHITAELGELPVRENDREVTIFKSLGLAVEDIFTAHLVLNRTSLL